MINRTILAIAITLFCVGSTLAQAPDELPAAPPTETTPPTETIPRTAIGSFLPTRSDLAGRFWISGDYLFTWVRGSNLPVLATTSSPGTPQASAGVLGAAGSTPLFGGWVDGDLRSGFRLGTGYWFNPEKTLGIDAGFMMTLTKTAAFSSTSTDGTILARPFTDANSGLPQAVLVAFPGSSNGSIDIRATSGNFYSAHVDFAETAYDVGWFRLTSLLGYRYYRYDESIRISQVIDPTAGNRFPFLPGAEIVNNDNFNTRNSFHGLDMGFRSEFTFNSLSLDLLTKIAIGRLNRTYNIGGDQTATAPGFTPASQTGGVLALSSNSGTFTSADWKCLPEVGFNLSWQIRSNITARVGYSFLFLNGVARAADQIDTTVNPNLFPNAPNAAAGGPARPVANNLRSDMWIQAVNFGLQFNY